MNSNQPAIVTLCVLTGLAFIYFAISEIAYPSPIQKIRSDIYKPGVQGIVDNMDTILHYSLPEYNVKITNIDSLVHDVKHQYTNTLLTLKISKPNDIPLINQDLYTIYFALKRTFPTHIPLKYDIIKSSMVIIPVHNILNYLDHYNVTCNAFRIEMRINLYDIDKDTLTKPMPYDGK